TGGVRIAQPVTVRKFDQEPRSVRAAYPSRWRGLGRPDRWLTGFHSPPSFPGGGVDALAGGSTVSAGVALTAAASIVRLHSAFVRIAWTRVSRSIACSSRPVLRRSSAYALSVVTTWLLSGPRARSWMARARWYRRSAAT